MLQKNVNFCVAVSLIDPFGHCFLLDFTMRFRYGVIVFVVYFFLDVLC